MQNLKIALVGLGKIAQLMHLPILKKMNNVSITAIADSNKSRLESMAKELGLDTYYQDYSKLLESEEIDAVFITTPTNTHKEIASAFIKKNIPTFIEKPIAISYKETNEIVELAKIHKVPVMVGMNMRYRPDVMLLKSIINSGDIGEIFYIKCGWLSSQSSDSKWFTSKEQAGGGVIFDLGIVILDLALWYLDFPMIDSVTTKNFFLNTKTVEDSSVSMIRCKSEAIISIETSWSIKSEKDSFYIDIFGTKGSASLNPLKIYKKDLNQYIDISANSNENRTLEYKKSFKNELKHFIGAVRKYNPVLSTAENALSRMKIIEAMYLSASRKEEIKL